MQPPSLQLPASSSLIVAGLLFAFGASARVSAQAPPPIPLGVRLVLEAGGVRVLWDDKGPAPDAYSVRVALVPVDGQDAGAQYELAMLPAGASGWSLQRELSGILPGRCYSAVFSVTAQYNGGRMPERAGAVAQAVCGAFDGRVQYVGAPLHAPLPAPAPPSDVRIEPDNGGGYRIAWQYVGAPGRFDAGIAIVNPNGELVAPIVLPSSPGSARSVALPRELNTVIASTCYAAIARVFAVAADGSVTLPGNSATPICVHGAGIRFPEAGSGGDANHAGRVALLAALALATAAGLIMTLAGAHLRRRRQ